MASNIDLFFNTSRNKRTFPEVLAEIQEYLASKYSTLITDNPEEQHQQITAYIAKYLNDYSLGVEGMSHEELIDKLYTEMAEFSFLTPYLFANDVEEININSWKDVKITYADGRVVPTKDRFQTPQHAVDVIRRLLHKSGMILDNSQPGVVGHLSNKIRITVLGNPLTDKEKGVAASIRIVNPKKLSRDDFIGYGTATAEMLDFLAEVLRFGLSICVTGSTGSGKTTLMSWILSTIPNEKRIFTIENGCREFDLVKEDAEGNVINNVVHTVTRFSDDPKQNYDQERLLEFALTCNPDIVCVGEMKSAEAFAAQEAARTGHAVITTTHANSCKATYYRMVTLCTSGNVYARLQDVLGIEYEGGQYVKYSGENLEYRLYDLHLDVENAPLAPSVPDGITQLNVTGTITVDVPLSFGFGHLPPMQITMKLNAKYVPRF